LYYFNLLRGPDITGSGVESELHIPDLNIYNAGLNLVLPKFEG